MIDISEIIKIRNKLNIPVGLAHNDIQQNYEGKEEQIANQLVHNDLFIELCQSEAGRNTRCGLDYYHHFSQELIMELANKEVKVVVGTDSHTGASLADFNDVLTFIQKNNLQYHEMVQ